MRLSLAQQAMLIKLWHAPSYELPGSELREVTRRALIRKGYVETVHYPRQVRYSLTYAGIRYNQTGKKIGE